MTKPTIASITQFIGNPTGSEAADMLGEMVAQARSEGELVVGSGVRLVQGGMVVFVEVSR